MSDFSRENDKGYVRRWRKMMIEGGLIFIFMRQFFREIHTEFYLAKKT